MSMKLHGKRRREGFSLLEVLVALGIMVIGIVAVMQLFPTSLLQARMAAERTIAAELANSMMSQIRASGATALFYGNMAGLVNTLYQQYGLYSAFSTSVQRLEGGPQTALQRVTFTVILPDNRTETFVTYVARQ